MNSSRLSTTTRAYEGWAVVRRTMHIFVAVYMAGGLWPGSGKGRRDIYTKSQDRKDRIEEKQGSEQR